ncbi:MAG: hypothetical protein HQL56_01640 [Magnetococcales bacterium]|nr:hypothetical protein [Magnetococcales bacterium]
MKVKAFLVAMVLALSIMVGGTYSQDAFAASGMPSYDAQGQSQVQKAKSKKHVAKKNAKKSHAKKAKKSGAAKKAHAKKKAKKKSRMPA